jgi:hypothetical protein
LDYGRGPRGDGKGGLVALAFPPKQPTHHLHRKGRQERRAANHAKRRDRIPASPEPPQRRPDAILATPAPSPMGTVALVARGVVTGRPEIGISKVAQHKLDPVGIVTEAPSIDEQALHLTLREFNRMNRWKPPWGTLVRCPGCGHNGYVPDASGRTPRCSKCGTLCREERPSPVAADPSEPLAVRAAAEPQRQTAPRTATQPRRKLKSGRRARRQSEREADQAEAQRWSEAVVAAYRGANPVAPTWAPWFSSAEEEAAANLVR